MARFVSRPPSILPSLLLCSALAGALPAAPIISEFMAANKKTLADEDGQFTDWIEIYNPDATSVNMSGWRLTDNSLNPAKWLFPDFVLAPGEFRIVFASSKNRINPAGTLHTNFALSAGGEYLALSSPAGVVATEFAPTFPPQEDDVSFGSQFSASNLVTVGQASRWLVPSSSSPTVAQWTAPSFVDTGWNQGPTGLGFGLLVPGILVKEVQTNFPMGNLAALDAALAGTPNPPTLSANTQIRSYINLLGDGGDGRFGVNQNFALPGDTHGLRATGFLSIPTAGAWTIGVNSDDGSRLRVDLNNDGDYLDANEVLILDDTGHGAQDIFSTRTLAVGSYRFEFSYFENAGGDEVEFFAQAGTHTAWNTGFRLIGDTANGGLAVSTTPDGSSGGSVIATNLQAPMLNLRTSAYARSTFSIANTTALNAISTLGLGMSFNDGFTAYLNGTKIAERNAPVTPAWNAVATEARDVTASLQAVNINVTAFRSSLVVGTNKLAVQGYNIAAADNSFLILPTLTGGALQAGGPFYFKAATPGTLNNTPTSLGFVADTVFSHKRGIYAAPFTLTVTTVTPGASLSYTLNGSMPSPVNGTIVPPPNATTPPTLSLPINSTAAVRVMAFKANFDPTNIDTNTYLFLDNVVQQAQTPPAGGWPTDVLMRGDPAAPVPGKYVRNGQEFDYGMDPAIVNSTNPAIGGIPQVKAALQAIPSVCVTVPVASLTDAATGIYTHAFGDGFQWEREASVEMLNDPGTVDQGFQENCGLRIRGGFSRTGDNPKHAFRLLFRGEYGAAKLNYPLFKDDPKAATVFDKFDLQTSQNYSWSFGGDGANTFLRELWSRDTQLAMNQPATRGRFVHLYLNGLYWGLYQIQERAEADFAATYRGGTDLDYDVVKVDTNAGYNVDPTAGDLNAWTDQWNKSRAAYFINTDRAATSPYGATAYTQAQKNEAYFRLMGRAADGVTPTADPVLLDADNLIDYMLIIFYSGNTDAPLSNFIGNNSPNNFYSIRDRRGGKGFFHIQHDGEHSLNAGAAAFDRVGPFNDPINGTWNTVVKSNPQFTHQDLAPNAEYRMRFADRTHRHIISPNGVMNTTRNQARMASRAAVVEGAIIAESARWGDSKLTLNAPLTAVDWRNAANGTLAWFNGRDASLLNQLRTAGLYPSVDAPGMSQSGGPIAATTPVTLTSGASTIYFTVNGADPRQVGGALNPAALVYTPGTNSPVTFVADGPSGTTWRYLDNGTDQGTAWRQPAFTPTGWKGPQAGQLGYGEADETLPLVSFGPQSANKYITTYFHTTFSVSSLTGLSGLTLNVKRDDGVIVYLNGTEVARDNMPAGAVDYLTPAAGVAGDDGQGFIPFLNLPVNLLNTGTNTLAVEVHQNGGGSSDLSFDCRLTATRTTGGTQINLPAGVATIRARVLTAGGVWSALNEQDFLVNTQAAAVANLTISEIMYHPANPTAAEFTAGFLSDQDFQWIEVQNTGTTAVDLRGAFFSEGIAFEFPNVSDSTTLLPPGGRVILCENLAAFRYRYGTSFDTLIAGQFSGALDHGGERIILRAADGTIIVDFTWSDTAPWPVDADGSGRSLVLGNPSSQPNIALPASWRPSVQVGGSPTTGDASSYAAWKTTNGVTNDTADTDADGLNSFTEYFHGTDPTISSTAPQLASAVSPYLVGVPAVPANFVTFTFERNLAADDVGWALEQSTTLATGSWIPAAVTYVGETVVPLTSRSRVTLRMDVPFAAAAPRTFFRLRATLR